MPVSVTMPQLGESVTEGTVTRWLKAEGDTVQADEPLLEVSTDKVDTEIPSPASGVLTRIVAAEDAVVLVGGELAVIGGLGRRRRRPRPPAAAAPVADVPAVEPEPEPARRSGRGGAGPVARCRHRMPPLPLPPPPRRAAPPRSRSPRSARASPRAP